MAETAVNIVQALFYTPVLALLIVGLLSLDVAAGAAKPDDEMAHLESEW